MKILHVIPSIGLSRGGPSTALTTQVQGQASRRVEVHVVTTDDNNGSRLHVPLRQPVQSDGVTILYFPRQIAFYSISWPLARWLSRFMRNYDLAHIHGLFSFSSSTSAFFAVRHGVPFILEPLGHLNHWGMTKRRRFLKRISFTLIERRIIEHAASVLYVSEQERKEATEAGASGDSMVLPLGIDLSPFMQPVTPATFLAKFPQLAGRTIVLFLSRLDEKKGLDILLSAFTRVVEEHPNVSLVIAGSGEAAFVRRLQEEAHVLGVADKIVWTGFLSGEDKLSAFSAATVFVLPSYSENFGIAAVEAMAAGLPLVLSNRVAIAEDTLLGRAALVVPCDPIAVAKAMKALICNSNLRSQMALNARALAIQKFSQESMTTGLISLYEDAIQTAAKRA